MKTDTNRLIIAPSENPSIPTEGDTWIQYRGRWGGCEALATCRELHVDAIPVCSKDFGDIGAGPSGPIMNPLWRAEVPEPSGGLLIGVLAMGALL